MLYRRIRGDMIEVYKMLNNHYDEEILPPLIMSNHSRRKGNGIKLIKTKNIRNIRANFFGNRVVIYWNELPKSVTEAPSTKSFERRLDKYWLYYDIKFDFDKNVLQQICFYQMKHIMIMMKK